MSERGSAVPFLRVQNVHKRFQDGFGILSGVDLDAVQGEIVCLLGPSGCGKTTLLRIIAGLETPDQGNIYFDGQDMASVPVHRRGFGLMFQDFALFPHHNVAANVAFGLRMQHLSRSDIKQRVNEMLDLVNLVALAHRDVSQLSGGEQQRVALARSLAPQPRLLMLDEPMGALDRTLRDRLLADLHCILKQVGLTVIYVTHDQAEAFAIADRIVLMRQGRVVQVGQPAQVYRQPVDAWVARFLGMHNLLPARWLGPGQVETEIGSLRVAGEGEGDLVLLIRPEAAVLALDATFAIRGTVLERTFLGALTRLQIQVGEQLILSFDLIADQAVPLPGEPVFFTLRPEAIVALSPS